MKKNNTTWEYMYSHLFPEPDVLVTDDHILKYYFETRTAKKFSERAVIEVWECFKEYLVEQLKGKKIRRLQLNRFCTLQKEAPKIAERGRFLNDPTHTMSFLDFFLRNNVELMRAEQMYEDIYGGLNYEEIQEKANESIMEDTLLKIKKRKSNSKNK